MAKLFGFFLTITLLAFAAAAQAQAPKTLSQGPDFSDIEKGQLTSGKLPLHEKEELDVLRKYNPARAQKLEAQIKRKIPSIDQVSQSLKNVVKIFNRLDAEEKLYRDGILNKKALVRSKVEAQIVLRLWLSAQYKYEDDLEEKYGSPSKKFKRAMQKFESIKGAWLKKFYKARDKKREKMGLPKWKFDMIYNKSDPPESENKTPSPKSADNKLPKNPKEDIEKNKAKREETNKPRRQVDRKGTSKPRSEEDRILEAGKDGMLTGKTIKLSDLEGCGGVLFVNADVKLMWGRTSTPCPELTGGRVASQADYYAHCNSFEDFSGPCGPPGPSTERSGRYNGVHGMPLGVFCLALHYNILSNKGDVYNNTVMQGNLMSIFKYDNGSRKLSCFYITKDQLKSLYEQFKNAKKGTTPTKPVAGTKPKKDCKSSGGLTGAMNCVTKRIEGAGGKNTKQPEKNPASASTTDPKTGITTKSVKNPDGTRTITRTDKNGKVLSERTVGKTSTSASMTDPETGITTKSVKNSDGSRTITRTDARGTVLSRGNVR